MTDEQDTPTPQPAENTADALEAAPDATGPMTVEDATLAEPEPVWATDEDRDDETPMWADDEPSGDEPEPVAAPRDPLVHALLVFAMALVVTIIATTAALYFFLATLNKAPRTTAERAVASSEIAVAEQPGSVTAWADLAYSYAKADRLEDALEAVKRGRKTENAEALAIVEADVLRFAGRAREAVAAYDRAETATLEMREKIRLERSKVGITGNITEDDALLRVYWGRGLAKRDLGEIDGAIADLELASKESSTVATVWSTLGDLYSQSGDTASAEKAYRYALQFVPDLPEALTGLRKLGEEK